MKTIRILSVIALAVAAAACAKETETAGVQEPLGPNTIVFKALAPTRTAIDDNDQAVTWVAGDEVKFVWNGGSANATASSSGASTTFSVEVTDDVDEIYAVYPADAGGSYSEGKVDVQYNGSRTDGSFAANSISVARAVKEGGAWSATLAFKNVACLLKVGVASSDIVKLQVKGIGEEAISGAVPVSIDDSGEPVFGTAASTGSSVSMTVSGPGNYYIPVMPGVTLSDGFRVNLFTDEETQTTPFFYYGSFTTERGKILKMNDIEAHAGQYYVTPAGAGTKSGQNWDNAMDAAGFKSFVESGDGTIIKGATFHFSAEEFTFGDYLQPVFEGYDENINFTFEGTVSGSDMTTFIGGSGQPAGMLWPKTSSDLTVKNIKFTGTDGDSNRAAIRVNNTNVKLQLENCVFDNNKTSSQSAAINLIKGTVTIKDCVFTNNTAEKGASIHAEQAKVSVSGCTFSNNSGNGNALHLSNTVAVVSMQDCEISGGDKCAIFGENANEVSFTRVNIHDNHTTDATNGGGAARLAGAGTYTFTDCEFVDNSSDSKGGAIAISSGDVHASFTGGKFQGNNANGDDDTISAGGAIYAIGTGVEFDCTNVLFKKNFNYVGGNNNIGGIIRVQQNGGIARFNGCTFDGNYTNRNTGDNKPCSAIVTCRIDGVNYYFNGCEFKENTSGTGNSGTTRGGLRGTVFATLKSSTFAFNNCSFHDNYGGRNTDDITWIGMDNANSTLILANTTIAGDNTKADGTVKNNWGVIKFQNVCNNYLINSILCSNQSNGNCFWINESIEIDGQKCIDNSNLFPVYCYYCKTSKEGDKRTNWGDDTGSGHDYYASSSCFGSWSAPYTWNGALIGTNSDQLAATADVNTEIQKADADFYAWLSSIGALGKDMAGNSRGATSWPGCYQN